MSYAARYIHRMGGEVSGADAVDREIMAAMREEGIVCHVGHEVATIPEHTSLILVSPALLPAPTEDMLYAKEKGIPVQTWQEYIGEVTAQKTTIAVCGAHGKSTTTAMTGVMLMHAKMDPTIFVGTTLKELGGTNIRVGKGEYLVIEADEYNDNFLHYSPTFVLCTSYDVDHLDYFKTAERYRESFVTFFKKIPPHGMAFIHAQEELLEIVQEAGCPYTIVPEEATVELSVPGKHMRSNAALVEQLGTYIGLGREMITQGLKSFHGTWRRMELVGEYKGVHVIDDYAHHPTELKASLAALREAYPHHSIIALFQPHQYSRTRELFADFSTSFGDADKIGITDIYASRDSQEDLNSTSGKALATAIAAQKKDCEYVGDLDQGIIWLKKQVEITPDAIIACFGAGSITEVARGIVSSR